MPSCHQMEASPSLSHGVFPHFQGFNLQAATTRWTVQTTYAFQQADFQVPAFQHVQGSTTYG